MSILVTGGAGFIGSHVVDTLHADGAAVTVLDNLSSGNAANLSQKTVLKLGDVRDSRAVREAVSVGVDYVFHLAGQIDVRGAVENPGLDAQVNVGGTVNVLKACVEAHVRRFVMSSTGGALYGEPKVLPATEQSPVLPLSPYGVSKYCAEQYVEYFHRACGLETVILRYANVYGPRQDPTGEAGVVGIFARQILLGLPCTVYGDGEQTRDFVYVDDIARANTLAVRGALGTFNIGTGVETSVNRLLAAFEHVAGHPVAREYVPARPGEVQRIALDAAKARHDLGWQPSVSLEAGLELTIDWCKEVIDNGA